MVVLHVPEVPAFDLGQKTKPDVFHALSTYSRRMPLYEL